MGRLMHGTPLALVLMSFNGICTHTLVRPRRGCYCLSFSVPHVYEAAGHWEETLKLLDRAAWPESCALLTASTEMETIKTQGAAPHKRGKAEG